MNDIFQYRLSQKQKCDIASNLIDFLQDKAEIKDETRIFVCNWILTGPEEKRKAFYDVWDITLKNYLPSKRPVLFRVCSRISKGRKIASFTGRLESARKFSQGKGILIICDTQDSLEIDEFRDIGEYKNSFFPLCELLMKAKALGGCGFNNRFLSEYIGEDEYVMRIDKEKMYTCKWL